MFGKKNKDPTEPPITFLNVGTQILTKDVMDQFLRTLGDNRTHYAGNASSAARILNETEIHIMTVEIDLADCSGFRLIKEVREDPRNDFIYYVLAVDHMDQEIKFLIQELEVDAVLTKPFTANDLEALVKEYLKRKNHVTDPLGLIKQAKKAFREKLYTQADKLYQLLEKQYPDDPKVIYNIGLHYVNKPNPVLAEQYLAKALELDPDFVPALATFGEFYWKRRNYLRAYEMLSRAQDLSPLNPDRALTMTNFFISWSIHQLQASCRIDSGNKDVWLALGKNHLYRKEYGKALEAFKKTNYLKHEKNYQEARDLLDFTTKVGKIK